MFGASQNTNTKRLDSIATITSGLTKGKKYLNKETSFVPYMRVANVQDSFLNLNEIKKIEATVLS
jgi:type I restriction enzyme S subunit